MSRARALSPAFAGGLPAPSCSRCPVSQMGSPYTIFGKMAGDEGTARIMPDNGICERLHKTVLTGVYRAAFRKKFYASIVEPQDDLDQWVASYNEDRPHQGRWRFGKTPLQKTFLDAIPIAREKMIAA